MNKEDQKIKTIWYNTRHIKPSTQRLYDNAITHYTNATNMTLTEHYNEAIQEEENHTPRYRKSIKYHLLTFQEYLDNTQLSENTKHSRMNIIKSFYESLDITLPTLPNRYDTTPDPENTQRMINKEIIQTMHDNAGTRDKAIINFTLMTGQGPNETAHLQLQDVVEAWNTMLPEAIYDLPDIWKYKKEILDIECAPLKIRRRKTNNRYWVYLPRETTRYILDYIYERVAGRNKKIRIQSLNSPLFVTKMGTACTRDNIGSVFRVVGERCGFTTPELFSGETRKLLTHQEGKQCVWNAYHYRKYFLNMCRRYAGTNSETSSEHVYSGSELGDFWIGHQARGSISHYLQYNDDDVQELRLHYLQMLPYLSIEREVEVVTSKDKQEFNEMKEKYENVLEELETFREYVQQKQKLNKLAKKYGLEEL